VNRLKKTCQAVPEIQYDVINSSIISLSKQIASVYLKLHQDDKENEIEKLQNLLNEDTTKTINEN